MQVRVRYPDHLKIRVLVEANPKRRGRKNHRRFQKLLDAKRPLAVAEAVERGITRGDLIFDAERGFIGMF